MPPQHASNAKLAQDTPRQAEGSSGQLQVPGRACFSFATPSDSTFRVYAFSGFEEAHRPYEFEIEDKNNQEEIYVHAEKDVNVYVKNDWKEHILHDQHRTVDNFSYSLVKGEDQQTVNLDRKVELLSDDHLTLRNSSHSRFADKWLHRIGEEVHIKAGSKATIEAGTELTIKTGGGFIKLDPSGVTISGAKIKINSGGSPGSGSGARPLLPGDSELVEEGTAPITQIDALRRAVHKPFCEECSEII